MFRQQLMSAELYYELKKLSRGVEMSLHSSLKIGHFFLKKARRLIGQGFWFFMESPKLWKRIDPGRSQEFEAQKDFRPYIHPPSSLRL